MKLMAPTKPYNAGQWTVARYNSFIKGALRAAGQRWPPKFAVRKKAQRDRGIYLCAGYEKRAHRVPVTNLVGGQYGKRVNNVFVDHIDPIIDPVEGFTTWDNVIERMFVEEAGLQVLCAECHKKKTTQERNLRKQSNAK